MTLKIVVCIKQVPETNKVKIDPVTKTMIRTGVKSIMNPDDKNALEGALKLKDEFTDAKVTVITMGPEQATEILKEAIAMGADRSILLSDRKFAGSDTWATSTIISSAIKKIMQDEGVDIVMCGRQAIDGDTAQVGPQIAEFLDFPIISYVEELKYENSKVHVKRALEDGYFLIEAPTPVVLTAIKELNTPRYPHMKRIFETYGENPERKIERWDASLFKLDETKIGLKGSPTRVKATFTPSRKFEGEMLEGSIMNITRNLVVRLKERQIL